MDPFDKKTLFLGLWFSTAISTLIFAGIFLIYLTQPKTVHLSNHNFKLYSALPEDTRIQNQEVTGVDARAKIIEDFFKKHSSPLAEYSGNFISVAEFYGLDWRLLPAIAMQESNGGKKIIDNSFNPFGYGIYGDLAIGFSSWEEGIKKVGMKLRSDYLDMGLKTPEQIMTKYTPSSLSKGGTWAQGVDYFMEELR